MQDETLLKCRIDLHADRTHANARGRVRTRTNARGRARMHANARDRARTRRASGQASQSFHVVRTGLGSIGFDVTDIRETLHSRKKHIIPELLGVKPEPGGGSRPSGPRPSWTSPSSGRALVVERPFNNERLIRRRGGGPGEGGPEAPPFNPFFGRAVPTDYGLCVWCSCSRHCCSIQLAHGRHNSFKK